MTCTLSFELKSKYIHELLPKKYLTYKQPAVQRIRTLAFTLNLESGLKWSGVIEISRLFRGRMGRLALNTRRFVTKTPVGRFLEGARTDKFWGIYTISLGAQMSGLIRRCTKSFCQDAGLIGLDWDKCT